MKRWVVAILFLLEASCTSSGIFPSIGTHLGNPLTLTVNNATGRLYVNNSNNKDLYDQGSIQVYSLATPSSPVLVGTQATSSFSGGLYLDAANQFLYIPNRYSTGASTTVNTLFQVNVNEASASFLAVTNSTINVDPFGVACCAPNGQMLAPTLSGTLSSYTIGAGAPTLTQTNLTTTANDGTVYTNPAANQLAIIGAQAFVPLSSNNILMVNLTELGGTTNPVDYVITNVNNPRGIATDGRQIYVVTVNTSSVPQLLILDPYALSATAGDTRATNIPVDTTVGLQLAALTMGTGTSTTDPEQVVVGNNFVFVSNTGDNSVTVVQCTDKSGNAATIATCSPAVAEATRGSYAISSNISVGQQPFGMALYSPAGIDTALYVANTLDNSITIINPVTQAVVTTFTGP